MLLPTRHEYIGEESKPATLYRILLTLISFMSSLLQESGQYLLKNPLICQRNSRSIISYIHTYVLYICMYCTVHTSQYSTSVCTASVCYRLLPKAFRFHIFPLSLYSSRESIRTIHTYICSSIGLLCITCSKTRGALTHRLFLNCSRTSTIL